MYTRQELINRLIRVDNISPDLDRADRVICMSEILAEACQFVGVLITLPVYERRT